MMLSLLLLKLLLLQQHILQRRLVVRRSSHHTRWYPHPPKSSHTTHPAHASPDSSHPTTYPSHPSSAQAPRSTLPRLSLHSHLHGLQLLKIHTLRRLALHLHWKVGSLLSPLRSSRRTTLRSPLALSW